ncbi:hypothetical protein THAOC_34099, partial [Thalassiosira oceanica]
PAVVAGAALSSRALSVPSWPSSALTQLSGSPRNDDEDGDAAERDEDLLPSASGGEAKSLSVSTQLDVHATAWLGRSAARLVSRDSTQSAHSSQMRAEGRHLRAAPFIPLCVFPGRLPRRMGPLPDPEPHRWYERAGPPRDPSRRGAEDGTPPGFKSACWRCSEASLLASVGRSRGRTTDGAPEDGQRSGPAGERPPVPGRGLGHEVRRDSRIRPGPKRSRPTTESRGRHRSAAAAEKAQAPANRVRGDVRPFPPPRPPPDDRLRVPRDERPPRGGPSDSSRDVRPSRGGATDLSAEAGLRMRQSTF